MISQDLYENYINILRAELVPAMGCTEPIAIAYAASKARAILNEEPQKIAKNFSSMFREYYKKC